MIAVYFSLGLMVAPSGVCLSKLMQTGQNRSHMSEVENKPFYLFWALKKVSIAITITISEYCKVKVST